MLGTSWGWDRMSGTEPGNSKFSSEVLQCLSRETRGSLDGGRTLEGWSPQEHCLAPLPSSSSIIHYSHYLDGLIRLLPWRKSQTI